MDAIDDYRPMEHPNVVIPRTIHQIWLRGGTLPPVLQENVDRLKGLNPGWEHRLWTEAEAMSVVQRFYGTDIVSAYSRIDDRYGAAKADVLRQLILYALGGVYFDIKSGSHRPLDDVLRDDDSLVISQWRKNDPASYPHRALSHVKGGEYLVCFIAAAPGHPLTLAMISAIRRNIATYRAWSAVGRNGTLRLAGPIAYTLALSPLLHKHPHRLAAFDDLALYTQIEGYDAGVIFPNGHYSEQTAPLIKMSAPREVISRLRTTIHSARSWISHLKLLD